LPVVAEPFDATDVMAFVLGLLAVIYALLWARDRERGMGWFALGMAAMGIVAAGAELQPVGGRFLMWSPFQLVLAAGLMALGRGLVDYLGIPAPGRRAALAASLLPAAAFGLLACLVGVAQAQIPRSLAQLPVALSFLSMGLQALWAARREPGAGHPLVAASLLAIPAIAVTIAVSGADGVSLRNFAFGPLLVLGLMLVPASLLRRRRELEAEVARRSAAEAELTRLNTSLELVVAERTADLQNLVAGLESFNRSVSHDLRGSLGGIGGLARLANESLQRGDDALARRSLPLIAEQADHSSRLMAALLSLARVGDATLQRQVVDLRRLVQQVVDQLRLEQGDRPMPQIEVAPEMPSVHADPELLKPVLANLIGNAIKFTRDAGAGRVQIGAASTADGVTVDVRDNGVGFDAQAAARLFTPFVRLHAATFDGHGVGLSIVRRAVERHGGRVWAESQPGQGAVFRFSLPA
jgi:signal transduction histidine kinase